MLSDLQTKKLTRYFEVYDVDDDGHIDAADFERMVENVRILRGESDHSKAYVDLRESYMGRWDALQASADIDDDGGVDIDEWLAYWQQALDDDARYATEVAAITDRLFTVFDTDEDGSIGPDEFCNFYGVFGLAAALVRSVFVELDADSDGVITRAELMDISAQSYRGDDPAAPANLLFGPFGIWFLDTS
jgi:Ca2+-binding EF-hand superfamily protein